MEVEVAVEVNNSLHNSHNSSSNNLHRAVEVEAVEEINLRLNLHISNLHQVEVVEAIDLHPQSTLIRLTLFVKQASILLSALPLSSKCPTFQTRLLKSLLDLLLLAHLDPVNLLFATQQIISPPTKMRMRKTKR